MSAFGRPEGQHWPGTAKDDPAASAHSNSDPSSSAALYSGSKAHPLLPAAEPSAATSEFQEVPQLCSAGAPTQSSISLATSRGPCVITAEQAQSIFIARQKFGARDLAARLAPEVGISSKAIRDIWSLRTWTHATRPHWTTADQEKFDRKQAQAQCRKPSLLSGEALPNRVELGQQTENENARASNASFECAPSSCELLERGHEAQKRNVVSRRHDMRHCSARTSSPTRTEPTHPASACQAPAHRSGGSVNGDASEASTAGKEDNCAEVRSGDGGSERALKQKSCGEDDGEYTGGGDGQDSDWSEDAFVCFEKAVADFDGVLHELGSQAFAAGYDPIPKLDA